MPAPNILESYLVSLSLKGPTEAEQREAEKAFHALAELVSGIVPTLTAAATAIVFATDKIAGALSKLYYESQKLNVPIREIDAARKAMVQSGTTLEKYDADLNNFAEKLRRFPQYKDVLKKQLGLTDADFKDAETAHSAYLKALAERRKRGDMQVGMLEHFGTDEDVIIARGRATYDPYFKKQMERNKGLDQEAPKAVALTRSLNDFGVALEELERKAAAKLFDKYGVTLEEMSTWVDAHSDEIIGELIVVIDQLVLAYKDIEPIAVPAVHAIGAGLDTVTRALDRLLGSPDGQHGGLHAVRYLLDALAIYIATKWAGKLLLMLGLRGIGAAAIGALGAGGVAAVGGAGALGAAVMPQPLNEGEDEAYRQAHPGWTPDKPKDPNWRRDAGAPPLSEEATGPPGSAARAVDIAETETGKTISDDDVQTFLRTGGHPDPEKAAWCAAFVGASLHKAGIKDIPAAQGGNIATSYAGWGQPVDPKNVKRGDVVVMYPHGPRGPGQTGGHVGLATGPMVGGQIPTIEGNTGHMVLHRLRSGAGVVIRRAKEEEEKKEHQSFLNGMHSTLAAIKQNPQVIAMLDAKQHGHQWTKTNNIGSRKHVTNIQLASTDPHAAASEIAYHMRAIHAGTLKSLNRLA